MVLRDKTQKNTYLQNEQIEMVIAKEPITRYLKSFTKNIESQSYHSKTSIVAPNGTEDACNDRGLTVFRFTFINILSLNFYEYRYPSLHPQFRNTP